MMGRMTLREVREALAAAKATGAKASAPSPTVQELESLARQLEREAEAGAPAEDPRGNGADDQGAPADSGRGQGPRRSVRRRGTRRRRAPSFSATS
jgi:hypothetical protein